MLLHLKWCSNFLTIFFSPIICCFVFSFWWWLFFPVCVCVCVGGIFSLHFPNFCWIFKVSAILSLICKYLLFLFSAAYLLYPVFFFFFFFLHSYTILRSYSENTNYGVLKFSLGSSVPFLHLFQFSSVTQSCPTLCNPMDHSTPGLPVYHQLPEFTQTHVLKSVMPSSHLILCRPLLLLPPIPPSIRVFSNESTLHMKWPKYWSFSFSISLILFFMCVESSLQIPGDP